MLSVGALVGHYEVVSPLGAGGMGEVYRARDKKLDRDVALKVLPEGFTTDPDRLARFEREAKVLASLNHPHIGHIYGLEEADGQKALVLELVEGPTLADRLAEGPIPVEEALSIAKQIAEALEAAHEQGIIHRDLKPANIKVKPDGTVKVLDFGLAKAFEREDGDPNQSQSPTLSARATQMGVILGTAPYMSPEQARGKPVDKRTDIWAFGCVLYEMLTGQRAFAGSDVTDTLASVLRSDPAWDTLPTSTPRLIRRLLRRCLEKSAEGRQRDIGDARLAIEDAVAEEEPDARVSPQTRPLPLLAAAFAAGLAVGAAAVWGVRGPNASPDASEVGLIQLTANPAENTVLSAALSSDGKLLVFADLGGLSVRVTATGETHAVPLPEDLVVDEVDWFPDGTTLLVGSSSSVLWKTTIFGGAPRKLAEEAFRAVVSPDGTRVAYLSAAESPSRQVYVMGAEGEDARSLAEGVDGESFWELAWSPDGAWLLVGTWKMVGDERHTSIQAVRIETGERHAVLSDPRLWQDWRAVLPFIWTSRGTLVYARHERPLGRGSSNLWSLDIDPGAVVRGEPSRLTQLAAVNFRDLSQAADGRIAFLAERNQSDVYVAELPGSVDAARPVTLDERDDYPSAWLPDGRTLVLISERGGTLTVSRQDLESGASTFLASQVDEEEHVAVSWNGTFLLYRSSGQWMRAPIEGGPGDLLLPSGERVHCAMPVKRCFLGERDASSTEYVFSELDLLSGKGAELARIPDNPPFTNWDVSPDGDRITIVHNDGRIRLLDLEAGSERVLRHDAWFFGEFVSFAADGEAVFVEGSRSGRAATTRKSLLRVSLGPEIKVEELRSRRNVWHVWPKASPDGRRLAFGAMTFTANAWMISEPR